MTDKDEHLFHDLVKQGASKGKKKKRSKIKRKTRTFKRKPKTVELIEESKECKIEDVSAESSSDSDSSSEESSVLSSIDEWQLRVRREQVEKCEDLRLTTLRRQTQLFNAGKLISEPRPTAKRKSQAVNQLMKNNEVRAEYGVDIPSARRRADTGPHPQADQKVSARHTLPSRRKDIPTLMPQNEPPAKPKQNLPQLNEDEIRKLTAIRKSVLD